MSPDVLFLYSLYTEPFKGEWKVRCEWKRCFVHGSLERKRLLLQSQLLGHHWLPLTFSSPQQLKLCDAECDYCRKRFSHCSHLRSHTHYEHIDQCRTVEPAELLITLSLAFSSLQQLQLCVFSPFSDSTAPEYCCHNIFFPRLQQIHKSQGENISIKP